MAINPTEQMPGQAATSAPSDLGAVLNKPMGGPDFSRLRTSADVTRAQQEMLPKAVAADVGYKQAEQQQKIAEATGMATAAKEVAGKLDQKTEEMERKKAEFPYPEFHPTEDNAASLGGLFSLVGTMGVMLGGSGKLSSINALNSMGGMLKGWQSGRKDLYEREKANFDKEFQRIKTIHADLQQTLDNYYKKAPYDKEAAYAAQQELAAKAGASSLIKAYADKNQMDRVGDLLKQVGEGIRHREDMKLKSESNFLAKMQMKMGTAGPQAHIYQNTGLYIPDLKTAANVESGYQGLRAIEDLQKRMQDPEIDLGVKAKLAPLFEKFASVDQSIDPAAIVNATLTGTDKTTVFLKDALLASYDIERAAQGGRLTVDMVKRTTPVLDPTNYTKEAYNQVLEGRRGVLYGKLRDTGFNDQQISRLAQTAPVTPFGGAAPTTTALPAGIPEGSTFVGYAQDDPTKRVFQAPGGKKYKE
jgi:hypothetical protein